MPLKMTNEVSLMDVITIGGLILGGAAVFFGYGVEINENSQGIAHLRSDVARVERQADEADQRVIKQLDELKSGMNAIRTESASERKDIMRKLDTIIEREIKTMRENGGPRQP